MILDSLANSHLYAPLGQSIVRALDFLRRTDLASFQPGRYEIAGENVYALVSEYVTKDRAEGRWEAHRRYIDLQCLVRGVERIGHALAERCSAGPYDDEKDLMWLSSDAGDFATLEPGMFMLLRPNDAHMPGIAAERPAPVKKVVVKIRASASCEGATIPD